MSEWLDRVDTPDDLKQLTVAQLKELAGEIRTFLLESISKTGGHLASNLGVVELTLALHYVFDFKTDRLLWDVGHQCYTHKLLTGRKSRFERLRQAGGISGFPHSGESDYDPFSVGHAGTSIPTAIGLALGEQIKQAQKVEGFQSVSEPKIVALVGDASIVNGASFEGLNNLGLVKRQLLIVLNDNSMAIDQTVGAIAKYFSRIRLSQTYEDLRKTAYTILDHLPKIGPGVEGAVEWVKKHIRMVFPGSQLFESLNVPYFGPVDGHDMESLVRLFRALKDLDHPVILHAYTKKGKGFSPARTGPSRFHSTGPFELLGDCVEPSRLSGPPTFTHSLGHHLLDLAQKDPRVVAITAAMCDGTGLGPFREQFPERFYDVGIAESAAVDVAAGLAKSGLRPLVCIYSTFLQRSFDQIFQEVALQNLPVVFCVDRAGMVGPDGPTHHGMMDIGFLRMMPNLVLIAPAHDQEMRLALEFALSQDKPVVIRYPKENLPSDLDRVACPAFELGQSVEVRPCAEADIVIVGLGSVLAEGLKAAELLEEKGIDAGVVNARFAVPLDSRILNAFQEGKKVITLEDHSIAAGFGSAILERAVANCQVPARMQDIRILGGPRVFIGHNSRKQQLMQAGLNADEIVKTALELLGSGLIAGEQPCPEQSNVRNW